MEPHDEDSVLAAWRVEEAANLRRSVVRERELLAAELEFDQLWTMWASTNEAVVVRTAAGREHHGTVVAVGADMVVLAPHAGAPVAVRMAHVTSAGSDALTVTGARPDPSATTFEELLRELADRADETTLVVTGGLSVRGRLEAVGVDVVVVRDPTGRRSYLRLDALSELSSMSMTSSSW
jgi:hypothetical protein